LELFVSILAILIGALASVLGSLIFAFKKGKREQTIEERIQKLTTSLRDATSMIGEVEKEIKERSTLAEKLQSDVEHYNQLVKISKPEVEAIAQLLRGELRREGGKTFWKSVIVNFVFFVLGVVTTLVIMNFTK
jgi:gas vesicle protein